MNIRRTPKRDTSGSGPRWRWRIAGLLNRLPGQCWADLVSWALPGRDSRNPWSPIDSMCRRDFASNGSCYCGKLRDPEREERIWRERRAAAGFGDEEPQQ